MTQDSGNAPPSQNGTLIRVYYEDTDAGGVVYYSKYLNFAERARTERLRAIGINQRRYAKEENIAFVVAEAHISCKASARLDALLHVSADIKDRSGARIVFSQAVTDAETGALYAEITATVCAVYADSMKLRRIPAEMIAALTG